MERHRIVAQLVLALFAAVALPVSAETVPNSSYPWGFTKVGGRVVFFALELWASDGTPGGTRRLSDFALADLFGTGDTGIPLPVPSLAILGSRVVTLGFDSESGFEPWVFDRAGGGGQMLADIF